MQEQKRNKVLITGASQGVGLSLAKEFAKLPNIELILVARRSETLKNAEAEVLKVNSQVAVRSIPCDLTDLSQIENLFRSVSHVDILVNNAGLGTFGMLEKQTIEQTMHMIRLNCEAPLRLMHQYMGTVKTIVNISSMAGMFPMPYFAVYSATKAFLNQLGQALTVEFQDRNVKIITVCPAGIKTNFHIHAGLPNEIMNKFGKTMLTSDQVAYSVVSRIYGKSPVIIPGITNRFFIFLSRFLPTNLVTQILGTIYKKYDRA